MIYCSFQFRKQYSNLGEEYRSTINNIVNSFNNVPKEKKETYLISLCGKNGKAKWKGISKTLYHLYPQGAKSTHRLFYCYASDLDEKTREKNQIYDGLVLIDYTLRKEKEEQAARRYDSGDIKYFQLFNPPNNVNLPLDQKTILPTFWFCLTKDQTDVLYLKQPSLIKGSAGAGKTLISLELFKSWIASGFNRILYLTYTDNLLRNAKEILRVDGIDLNLNTNYMCTKFDQIYKNSSNQKIIGEKEAREIIRGILSDVSLVSELPKVIIFSDYFVYSYIRGVMKGRFEETYEYYLDSNSLESELVRNINDFKIPNQVANRIIRMVAEVLKTSEFNSFEYNKLLPYLMNDKSKKSEKKQLKDLLDSFFGEMSANNYHMLNQFRIKKIKYDYISKEKIFEILGEDGLSEDYCNLMYMIFERYNKEIRDCNFIDDNDVALNILNAHINEEELFDGIIIDEVQDLTEIQIQAIVNLCNSDNISFFGDPNQTINPTVYDYGRFNSFVYKKTLNINRRTLKTTYRCGPNLLEYINHLTSLRRDFNITTDREDLEEEISGIEKTDTYWACLVEDKNIIDSILEKFLNAVDCYLIVDNDETKADVIDRIKEITSDYADEEIINNQIITVQNAKGLESKNVIIFNLISDNIDIFENIISENNKVSSMTFNKLYVSCTRAEDSLIICEEKLNQNLNLREKIFNYNGKSKIEKILVDDIESYLSISINPEVFYEQAIIAMEDNNYLKAYKKNNIAIKNILNQFVEEDSFASVLDLIKTEIRYNILKFPPNVKDNEGIELFLSSFEIFLAKFHSSIENAIYDALIKRKELLIKAIRTKEICKKRNELDEYLNMNIMTETDIIEYLEEFILLENFECAYYCANNLTSDKQSYEKLIRYIFDYESYENVVDHISRIQFKNLKCAEYLFAHKVKIDAYDKLEASINDLEDLING